MYCSKSSNFNLAFKKFFIFLYDGAVKEIYSRCQEDSGGEWGEGLLTVMHSSHTTPSNTTLILVLGGMTDESVVLLVKVKE